MLHRICVRSLSSDTQLSTLTVNKLFFLDIEKKIAAVAPLCNYFDNATDHVISYVNKTSVKELKCEIVPFALPVEYFHGNKLKTKNIPTIIGIFVAVLIFLLAIVCNVKRIRVWISLFKFGVSFSSRNTSKSHQFSIEDIAQQASQTEPARKGEPKSCLHIF